MTDRKNKKSVMTDFSAKNKMFKKQNIPLLFLMISITFVKRIFNMILAHRLTIEQKALSS